MNRISWIDIAKGLGIFLVVVGHTLIGLYNANIKISETAFCFFTTYIYSFHMPLFFFLSGWFIDRSLKNGFFSFLKSKLIYIAYPYFIWSLIQSHIRSWVYHESTNIAQTFLYTPYAQFWFLYSLFFLSVVYGALRAMRLPWPLILAGTVFSIALVHNANNPYQMFLERRFLYAPYFVIGMLVSSVNLENLLSKKQLLITSAVCFFVLFFPCYYIGTLHYPWYYLSALLGITASLSLCIALQTSATGQLLQTLGQYSMAIFILHVMASACIRIILQQLLHIQSFAIHCTIGCVAGIIVPIGIAVVLKTYGKLTITGLGNSSKPLKKLAPSV